MTVLDSLFALARQALTEPREAGRGLLQLGIPFEVIWPAILLVSVASALLSAASEMLAPTWMSAVPHFYVAALFVVMVVGFSVAVRLTGRLLGGQGSLRDALLLTTFLQAIFLVAQVVQLVLIAVLPILAALYSIAVLLLGIWINVNFIDALHGFNSLAKSFGVFILSCVAFFVALIILATIVGVRVQGPV